MGCSHHHLTLRGLFFFFSIIQIIVFVTRLQFYCNCSFTVAALGALFVSAAVRENATKPHCALPAKHQKEPVRLTGCRLWVKLCHWSSISVDTFLLVIILKILLLLCATTTTTTAAATSGTKPAALECLKLENNALHWRVPTESPPKIHRQVALFMQTNPQWIILTEWRCSSAQGGKHKCHTAVFQASSHVNRANLINCYHFTFCWSIGKC